MRFYGIASAVSNDVAELKASREEAERELAEILEDAPEVADDLGSRPVDLEVTPN